MNGVTGEIKMFAGNFAPRTFAFCAGQLLPIAQNTALFSIIGTIYGGDGRTTCALPDLQGRTAVHAGRGPGLANIDLGERGGSETETITTQTMPNHTHTVTGHTKAANAASGNIDTSPLGNFIPEFPGVPLFTESTSETNVALAAGSLEVTIGNAGGGLSHNNMSPFLVLNYIICLTGIYPSRS